MAPDYSDQDERRTMSEATQDAAAALARRHFTAVTKDGPWFN